MVSGLSDMIVSKRCPECPECPECPKCPECPIWNWTWTHMIMSENVQYCPELVRRLSGFCPVFVRRVSGECPESVQKVSGKCPESVRKVSGKCPEKCPKCPVGAQAARRYFGKFLRSLNGCGSQSQVLSTSFWRDLHIFRCQGQHFDFFRSWRSSWRAQRVLFQGFGLSGT